MYKVRWGKPEQILKHGDTCLHGGGGENTSNITCPTPLTHS